MSFAFWKQISNPVGEDKGWKFLKAIFEGWLKVRTVAGRAGQDEG